MGGQGGVLAWQEGGGMSAQPAGGGRGTRAPGAGGGAGLPLESDGAAQSCTLFTFAPRLLTSIRNNPEAHFVTSQVPGLNFCVFLNYKDSQEYTLQKYTLEMEV